MRNRPDPDVLKEFAKTPRHLEILEAVKQHGSHTKAAESIGCARQTVDGVVMRLERNAAAQGVSPHRDLVHQTAAGFQAKRGINSIQGRWICGPAVGYTRARKGQPKRTLRPDD